MKVKEFYDYILQHMTAEEALMKLLQGPLLQYEKLKFESPEKAIHPALLISMAAMDMGWQLAVINKKDDAELKGLVVGTEEYMEMIFPKTEEKK